MDDKELIFPSIKKSIEDFLEDEDGNITRSKLVTIGAIMMVMTLLMTLETEAKHGSHKSHGSHSSHSSTSYYRSHSNHASHSNHGSHSSHSSHTSHSNTVSHSNSLYSAEGDVSYGPSVSSIARVSPSTAVVSSIPDISVATANVAAQGRPAGVAIEDANTIVPVSIPAPPSLPEIPATIPPQQFQPPNLEVPLDVNVGHKSDNPLMVISDTKQEIIQKIKDIQNT